MFEVTCHALYLRTDQAVVGRDLAPCKHGNADLGCDGPSGVGPASDLTPR
jgi:hypothetical protein